MVGMSNPDAAAEHARLAARARWGTQVVDRAVETVVSRSAELGDEQRERLREVAGEPAKDGDAQ